MKTLSEIFREVFENPASAWWFGTPIRGSASTKKLRERQAHRVFALLFMAEMAADQQL